MSRQHRLQITTPAESLALLTVQELRTAAGVADSSQDVALQATGLRTAAKIMAACNIVVGEGGAPTLLQETLKDTFWDVCAAELLLSRRHEIIITSVTVDGVALDINSVVIDHEAGLLTRRLGNSAADWRGREIVVVYKAGFAAVPEDLKAAAAEMVIWERANADRDPFVKSESVEIPGVSKRSSDLWVGALPGQAEGPVPAHIMPLLRRFRN